MQARHQSLRVYKQASCGFSFVAPASNNHAKPVRSTQMDLNEAREFFSKTSRAANWAGIGENPAKHCARNRSRPISAHVRSRFFFLFSPGRDCSHREPER